jgi:hypothetical protein
MVDCREERKNNDFLLYAVHKDNMYKYSSTVVTHMKVVLRSTTSTSATGTTTVPVVKLVLK